ncbi:hypothetical protein [Pseudalkalibacillus decolorationis]|uniref:hypothetical protein n=1 Tax=Pseudalkalibacillus decolorationis TaxID=163879 RepID=UPI0021483A9E|nr:hypothetical protein [Pseudalkalibacillus decolorationis]
MEDIDFMKYEVRKKLKSLLALNSLDREREELEKELEEDCYRPTSAYICPHTGLMRFNNSNVEKVVIEHDEIRTAFDTHYNHVKENAGQIREGLQSLSDHEQTIIEDHRPSEELDQVYIKLYEFLTGIKVEKHKQAELQRKAEMIIKSGRKHTKSGKKILAQVG